MENRIKTIRRKLRVLVVDDNDEIRNLIRFCLANYAFCDAAGDGDTALEKFGTALRSREPYDLVLLDILMPGLNGRQVLERMRSLEKSAGKDYLEGVKIVMLTALDDTANVLQTFKRGCDSYLVKPFDEESLLKELRELGLLASEASQPVGNEPAPGHVLD